MYILEKVDKEDNIYYLDDDIIFTIICINNSNEKIENILIRDILPKEVIPQQNNEYEVSTSKGVIKQYKNIIEVKIDFLDSKEAVKVIIKGKVSD